MLENYALRYRKELLESVVPFWMRHSLDAEYGGFFTCLDREGMVYDSRKYVWLQGRQVWTLCRLYNQVEPRPEWLEAARRGLDFLRRHAFDPQGRVYFSLTRDGTPAGYQRKPYAGVFLTIGLSEFYRATGEEQYLQEAIDLYDRVCGWIADPTPLGRPVLPGQPSLRTLADLMVISSMSLELNAARPDPRYVETMRRMIPLILEHRDSERKVLLENVVPGGKQAREWPEGRQVCPGHSLEVAWFLLHMLEHCPDEGQYRQVLEIMEGSLESGWDRELGGLLYFVDIEGKPSLQLESDMKLWWPHTEAIYSLVLAYLKTGDQKWLRWLERVDEYSFRVFADRQHGEWWGYCDRSGRVALDAKGGNYKGCFHVPRALLLSLAAIERFSR